MFNHYPNSQDENILINKYNDALRNYKHSKIQRNLIPLKSIIHNVIKFYCDRKDFTAAFRFTTNEFEPGDADKFLETYTVHIEKKYKNKIAECKKNIKNPDLAQDVVNNLQSIAKDLLLLIEISSSWNNNKRNDTLACYYHFLGNVTFLTSGMRDSSHLDPFSEDEAWQIERNLLNAQQYYELALQHNAETWDHKHDLLVSLGTCARFYDSLARQSSPFSLDLYQKAEYYFQQAIRLVSDDETNHANQKGRAQTQYADFLLHWCIKNTSKRCEAEDMQIKNLRQYTFTMNYFKTVILSLFHAGIKNILDDIALKTSSADGSNLITDEQYQGYFKQCEELGTHFKSEEELKVSFEKMEMSDITDNDFWEKIKQCRQIKDALIDLSNEKFKFAVPPQNSDALMRPKYN